MNLTGSGWDDLERQVADMSNAAKTLEGNYEVNLDELFSPEFMTRYTKYPDIETFFEESPWDLKTDNDFEDIPEDEFSEYVSKNTVFDSSDEMVQKAGQEWVATKLGF